MEVLRHPYTLTDTDELPAIYLAGTLAVFDAGLGIAAALGPFSPYPAHPRS